MSNIKRATERGSSSFYKRSVDDFIAAARKVHGDYYDYSKVDKYSSNDTVTIICPIHGEFQQKVKYHLAGHGCKECGNEKKVAHRRFPQDQFIKKLKEVFGDKYDYSKVVYKNSQTPVEIICPEHGSFFKAPFHLLKGKGCPKCKGYYSDLEERKERFIEKANKVHNNKYDYENVVYKSAKNPVEIICPLHGPFLQTPNMHIMGNGCPLCNPSHKMDKEEFIEKANLVHRGKYDYSKVNYINSKKKVEIICLDHGSFFQTPNDHLMGHGCPVCNTSKGEMEISKYLDNWNINYVPQKTFIGCKDKRPLRFDFYLPEYNVAIEYQGQQHYEPVSAFGGLDNFLECQIRDEIKRQYCYENNIVLLEIAYNQDIEKELSDYLK